MQRNRVWDNADEMFDKIAGEIVDSMFEKSDLEKMLCILSPGQSILIDKHIGLIGEYEDNAEIKHVEDKVFSITDERKCGSFYKVVSGQGLIVLDEQVIYSYKMFKDLKETGEYLFILKNESTTDAMDDFFDTKDTIPAVVIYNINDETYSTNCEKLGNKYHFTDTIRINSLATDSKLILEMEYNGERYFGCEVNSSNNIGILKAYK